MQVLSRAPARAYAVLVEMPWRRLRPAAAPRDEDDGDVARARAGNEAGFEALVQRHERDVYNLAYRMLQDRDEALEAAQDTFLRVLRGLPAFRGDATFRTWLFGIALNVCRNRLARGLKRERATTVPLVQDDPVSGEAVTLPLADPAPGPEAAAGASELRRALAAALGRLAPEQREIILLREVHGLDYDALALALRCPTGTVKSRLARARAALRAELEGVWP
jgi:RNA polymerase sigma-70 factor (ECF subfamily)